MKLIVSLTIFMMLLSLGSSINVKGCALNINYNLFNLCPFSEKTLTANSSEQQYTFGLTRPIVRACNGSSLSWATVNDTNDILGCVDVAKSAPTYSLIRILVTFPSVEDPDDEGLGADRYQLTVRLECDPSQDNADQTIFKLVNGPGDNTFKDAFKDEYYNITITAKSSYGKGYFFMFSLCSLACPLASFNKVVEFVAENKVLFVILFVIFGLLVTFYGLKLFQLVVFTIAVSLTTFALFAILAGFTEQTVKTWLLWTLFIISLIAGVGMGIVSLKYNKVGHFLIGGALGIMSGSLFYGAILSPFIASGDGSAVLILVWIIAALIGGIAGVYLIESIVIVATSALGSYITIRTLSLIIGGFPLESEIANGSKSFNAAAYGYILAMVALTAGGTFYQFKMKSKNDEQHEAFLEGA